MRNFLKSLFGRDDASVTQAPATNADATHASSSEAKLPVEDRESAAVNPSRDIGPPGSVDDILAELTAQVCATMPDPRTPEEIDVELHMYDAGYVTSITAADLLAYIDERYGLDISETKLIGPLQNLAALAAYIHSNAGREKQGIHSSR